MENDIDYKQSKIDGIVKQLQTKCFEVTKSIHEGKDIIKPLLEMEIEVKKLRGAQKQGKKKKVKQGDRRDFDWRPFMKWLKDNEFPNVGNIEICYNPESGHGLVATKDLKQGELILQVPLRFMMTNKTAVESKLALLLHNDQMLQSVYSLTLALHLLLEQRTLNSFWGPYINSLPKKVPNSPLYWDIGKVQRLKGTYVFEELAKFKASFVKAYCHVYFRLEKQLEKAIMKRSLFTYDSLAWAYTITYSRQNRILVAGPNDKPVAAYGLIPVFDLMNHNKDGTITTNYDFENKVLESYALRDFKKGEEIKIFYGPRPNTELFIYSGFVAPDNQFNYTALQFGLVESDKFREKKIEILKKHNIPAVAKYALPLLNPIQDELLSFLRIAWISTEDDLGQAEIAFQKRPINLQNELKVFSILELKLTQVIESFPTSLEEDNKQLVAIKKNIYSVDDIFILQLLIDEKHILTEALKKVKSKKKTIENKIKKKEKRKVNDNKVEKN